jgi:hypothetical protein
VPDPAVIGRVGTVVLATRGTAGMGEITVRVRGGIETYLAWSDGPLPAGTEVLVVGWRGPRTVDVVPWSESLGSESLGSESLGSESLGSRSPAPPSLAPPAPEPGKH